MVEPWPSSGRKPTIIAIDDFPPALAALAAQLGEAGFKVVTYTDPNEALQQVIWFPPDLVIVDLYMPAMSGLQFIEHLKLRAGPRMPPCLVVSGSDEEAAITSTYEAGALDFIHKPFTDGELIARVKHLLHRRVPEHPTPSPTSLPATIGGYEICSELGRGGMGVVYAARRPDAAALVALKAIWSQRQDPDTLLRFRREIDILAGLSHPGLARLHDAGRDGSIFFYTMDFIVGPSLDEVRNQFGRFDPGAGAQVLSDLSDVLDCMHGRGFIHRDLKPSNILLTAGPRLMLVDFGLAKSLCDDQLTHTAELIGTPSYLAPEFVRGEAVDGRADLFSLGLVALELLRGERVVPGDNPYTVMLNLSQGQFPRAREQPELVKTGLAPIIDRLLEVEPARRFASGAELKAALGALAPLPPSDLFERALRQWPQQCSERKEGGAESQRPQLGELSTQFIE